MKDDCVPANIVRRVAAAAAVFIAVFAPLNAYFGNVQDLSTVRPWMLIAVSATLCLVLHVLFCGMFRMLCKWPRVQTLAVTLTAAFVFAAYVQGNLIGLDYGVLDGREIPWDSMVGVGILNAVAWVGIVVGVVLLSAICKRRFFGLLGGAMTALVCYLLLISVIRGVTCPGTRQYPAGFSDRGFDELSREENVIVVVLDSLDRHLMDRLLEQRPEWRSKLGGFTYYRNVIGMFPLTHFALPQIITGVADENRESYAEYKDRAYGSSPVLSAAAANDFEVSIYANDEFSPSGKSLVNLPCIRNGVSRSPNVLDAVNYWISAYNAAVFSYLPHFAKRGYRRLLLPCAHVEGGGCETGFGCERIESKFFECIAQRRFRFEPGKRFKLYHCFGTHLPRYDLEKLEDCLQKLCDFVCLLKERGVYDRCRLVVLADHGQEVRSTPTLLCNNAGGAFAISDIPFTYADLPIVLKSAMQGMAQDWQVPACAGNRTFLYNKQYDAEGREVLDPALAKNAYEGPDLTLLRTESVELESVDGKFWLWTLGSHARIEIPLTKEARGTNVWVSLSVMQALLGAGHPQMRVSITADGRPLLERTVVQERRSGFSLDFFVPAAMNTRDILALDIAVDKPTTPHDLDNRVGDFRRLGLQIKSFAVSTTDSLPRAFRLDVPSPAYRLLEGFAEPEAGNGCWTASTSARLSLVVGEEILTSQRARIALTGYPFLFGQKATRQRVSILCRGKEVFSRCLGEAGDAVASFDVPSQCAQNGCIELHLLLPDAVSPKEVGHSADPRKLALCLRSCTVELEKKGHKEIGSCRD